MKLEDFVKSQEEYFLRTDGYGTQCTKKEIIEECRDRVESWLCGGSEFTEIKEDAVQWVLNRYEPYTDKLVNKVEKTMQKLGLYEKEITP